MGSVIIEIRGIKAFLRNARWRCADKTLLEQLNERSASYLPDTENARVLAEEMGGTVVRAQEDAAQDSDSSEQPIY